MKKIRYYSTNNKSEKVNFETALMNGLGSNYGLYMISKEDIPKLASSVIQAMKWMAYHEVALEVLYPFLWEEISRTDLADLLLDAYSDKVIPTEVQHVTGRTHIMWLSHGPTYSFKDYAARFFARMLSHFLKKSGQRRVVVVATSGDTGGAVADALHGLEGVDNLVFFPRGSVTERQRRQMTTLGGNVYAFEVNGDFDVCQTLAKRILGDKGLAEMVFGERDRFTSANSISIGRLLPQAVYPFFAYSRLGEYEEPMIASVPSGNFGDMMGTVIAREMGLPIGKILCGVNENREFPDFLKTGRYTVRPSVRCPSSAMIVSNPSNFARLVDLYGGRVYDERDAGGKVIREGVMEIEPDMTAMREDFFSIWVSNADHYKVIREVYEQFGIIIEPHGAVGWRVLDHFLKGNHNRLAVIYETADPGKFPDEIQTAIGVTPKVPERMVTQANLEERIFTVGAPPHVKDDGTVTLSDTQYQKATEIIRDIFRQ
jgi:threonine synthase